MIKNIIKIDGMACGMCEAHVSDTIRKEIPSAKKVSASHSKGEAVFITEDAIDEQGIVDAIGSTGYTVLSVSSEPYEKKGLFGLF
ncbi:MAG: cation transporter [Lachnospiraceae bacterium]|nr:cation transporter [Lachnospiraceae bacterium]